MGSRGLKETSRTEKRMGYGFLGIKTGRRREKQTTRTVSWMGYGWGGTVMGISSGKKTGRTIKKGFLQNTGTAKVCVLIRGKKL